jgi:hypothetical protein
MKFETYAHNQSELGALMRYSVPTNCEISIETLNQRLADAGLNGHNPRVRSTPDAVRLAFSHIADNSVKRNEDGSITSIVINNLPRRKDEPCQRWSLHRQTKDRDQQVVNYEHIGDAVLYDEGGLTVPYMLGDGLDVHERVSHFINYADHTKIRECIRSIVHSVAKPIPLNGISFISADRIEFLKDKVFGVFNNMPVGEVSFSLYEISNTPQNVATLKQEITSSISDEIDKIRAGIIKAKGDNSLNKSTVAEWLKTIELLKANMGSMGILDVKIPDGMQDLEVQIAALKSEVEKPKSKRVLHSL